DPWRWSERGAGRPRDPEGRRGRRFGVSTTSSRSSSRYCATLRPPPPMSHREGGSGRHLLQDDEVAGVPRLGDDVEPAPHLPQHRVVDVLEVLQAQIVLREERGYQSVVLEDVDRRALAAVGTIEGGDHRIPALVVDVAGQGPRGHLQGGEVLAVPREAVDLGVRPVGHLDPPGARGDRDAVARPELPWRAPLAAEG